MLHCGDYREVLAEVRDVDLIVTSPPYNIGSQAPRHDGNRRKGLYDRRSFGGITSYSDRVPEREYQESQREFLVWCSRALSDTGLVVYNHKPRHRKGVLLHPTSWFPNELELYEEVVWDRGSTHNHCPKYLYQQTERLYVLRRKGGGWPHVNRSELTGDVWHIPLRAGRKASKKHDAAFPLELPRKAIRLWCPPHGVVCDPYSGSGTTMVAAHLEGRRFVGAELSRAHWEGACERLEEQRSEAA